MGSTRGRRRHEGVVPEGDGEGEEGAREHGRARRERGRRTARVAAGMPAQTHLRGRSIQAGRRGRRETRRHLPSGEGALLETVHLAGARARAGTARAGPRGPGEPRLHVETAVRVASARPGAPREGRQPHRRRRQRASPHVRSSRRWRAHHGRARGGLAAAAPPEPTHLVPGRGDARGRTGERGGMSPHPLRAAGRAPTGAKAESDRESTN